MPTVTFQTDLGVSAERAFDWHAQPGAFDRLMPPWERIEVLEREGGIKPDGRLVMRIRKGPLWVTWEARHGAYIPGELFIDDQIKGPFRRWLHKHRFEARSDRACTLIDEIEYALPGGSIGAALGGGSIRTSLEQTFAFRHRRTREDLMRHDRHASQGQKSVVVSGSHGLVGSALSAFLSGGGHEVRRLLRSSSGNGSSGYPWNPDAGEIDLAAFDGADAVVHLAGESIATGRWNAAKKQAILESRVAGTRLMCETLAKMEHPPRTLVCASAIGFYGDRGDEAVDEASGSGDGFLAEVCRAWEEAAEPARQAGIRVVHLRIGMVVSAQGGALVKMLPPFKMGAGGRLGSGRQFMSWISLDDLVGVIHEALFDDRYQGPVNAVSPHPVTNLEFTKTLGKVLKRPTIFPMPGPMVRLVFGEMGDELLLSSTRVTPSRLNAFDYPFSTPQLEEALRVELGATQ